MITIALTDGLLCPIITCDRCDQRIADLEATPANFEWDTAADGTVDATRIVHKGFCCAAYQHPDPARLSFWMPLHQWLVYLAWNTGAATFASEPGVCFECGQTAAANHHVVPRSLGGRNTLPLCDECHTKIHSAGQPLSLGRLARAARLEREQR